MRLSKLNPLAVGLVCCLLASGVAAQPETGDKPEQAEGAEAVSPTAVVSPHGFELDLPDQWAQASADEMSFLRAGEPDAQDYVLFAYDVEDQKAYNANIIVKIIHEPLRPTDHNRRRVELTVKEDFRNEGYPVHRLNSSIQAYGQTKCIEAVTECTIDGERLIVRQAVVPGDGQAYMIIFTTLAADAPAYNADYRSIVSSFNVPGYDPNPFANVDMGVLFAVLAVGLVVVLLVIGGTVFVIYKLTR